MNARLVKALKFLLFFGVGFTILYLVFSNQQQAYLRECSLKGIDELSCSLLDKVIHDFSHAHFGILLLSVFMFMMSNVIRALRWHLLLQPLGYNPRLVNSFGATMIGYLLNLTIPRSGEIAKVATLSKNENIPIDVTLGTIVTDRIVDVLCLLLVFVLTILFAHDDISGYLEENLSVTDKFSAFLEKPGFILLALGILGFIGLMAYRFRAGWMRLALVQKIINFLKGIWKGAWSVFQMERKFLFIFYTILIWVLYYLMTYVVFFAFVPTAHLSAVTGLVVFLFGSLGIVIPSPGGMGSYHFLVGQALALYGISGVDGFSFANIMFFTIQIFGNIFFGGLALLYLPIYNRKK